MKVVLQRVSSAEVTVDGRSVGEIGTGFVLLVGFKASDGELEATWMADKVVGLRVFSDVRKGRRPSFIDAAPPEIAIPLYENFVTMLSDRAPGRVETGEFGAVMDVKLVNQGPVTILLER